jgi:leucine dehydrogenase
MKNILEQMQERQFEDIHFHYDRETGLKSIIAIHNTQRGPALGGCRFFPYASEEEGLADVMNLAQAMTYKAALAGLPLGGGKSIIFGDAKKEKNEKLLEAFASFVESLGGNYITSVDSGTSPTDMNVYLRKTKHVAGYTSEFGGAGDPSPVTALGVFEGIKACAKHEFGTDDLSGRVIAVQGTGNVGATLCKMLKNAGASLIIADSDESKVKALAAETGAKVVGVDQILTEKCDILAPCAMGNVINDSNISKIQCKIVAGGANNPLASIEIGEKLHKMGILYAPDFAINAGGLIHVAHEIEGYNREKAEKKTRDIYFTIEKIMARSEKENLATAVVARKMAKEILEQSK